MIRIAMLSRWHVHANDYARQLAEHQDVTIVAVWDEIPARGSAWAEELGAAFEPDLDTLLARADVDAVVVNTPTNLHGEVMTKAALAGKHIFTEKVMALTLKECDDIAAAVNKTGVRFCISFPHRIQPNLLAVKKVLDDGLLGEPTLLRIRNAHDGAVAGWLPEHFYDPVACGGGAMMDLGAHPMYLSRWLLGAPVSVQSAFGHVTGRTVEDNAVSVIRFESGAISVAETSLVSPGSPFILELYGTRGSVLVGGTEQSVRLFSRVAGHETDGHVALDPKHFPDALPMPIRQWLETIRSGEDTIVFGLEEGRQLTELMVMAYEGAVR